MKFAIIFAAFLAVTLALSPSFPPDREGRMVGGEDAEDGAYPFQVSLIGLLDNHFCSGAIINQRWIISAAHCLVLYPWYWTKVYAGSNFRESGGTLYNVTHYVNHHYHNNPNRHNDIGLLHTDRNIVFTDRVQPIPLETRVIGNDEGPMSMTGWGRRAPEEPGFNALQKIIVRSLDYEECFERHNKNHDVGRNHICTVPEPGKGPCGGDSGAPVVLNGKLVGLLNWAVPCARGYPDVSVRISSYIDWILSNSLVD